MKLGVWIVTEVRPGNPQASVHFAVASSPEKAQDLVARRTRLDPSCLSVVLLRADLTRAPRNPPRGQPLERYLGPLEKFSPFLRESCAFCHGTGLLPGSRPPEQCSVCGGSGLKTVKRD
jgi:hypothetical protein